jgi:hypothetical protein
MSTKTTHTSDGTSIAVGSIHDLNDHFEQHRREATLAVTTRHETRGGQRFGLGGLAWTLRVRELSLTVTTETAEGEVLPDLPVVRAGYPYGLAHNSRTAVAA